MNAQFLHLISYLVSSRHKLAILLKNASNSAQDMHKKVDEFGQ